MEENASCQNSRLAKNNMPKQKTRKLTTREKLKKIKALRKYSIQITKEHEKRYQQLLKEVETKDEHCWLFDYLYANHNLTAEETLAKIEEERSK